MRIGIAWGRQHTELEVAETQLAATQRALASPPLLDPVQAMSDALERPLDYPALWRALTPDDQVAIVVDEQIPQIARLLIALLTHVRKAGVQPEAITLLCLPSSAPAKTQQSWLDDLPDEFQDVRIEIHDPSDRRKLAYLATTKQGRRVYLNRSAVDAAQLVLFTRRSHDPLLHYRGAETTLFPGLSDRATIEDIAATLENRVDMDAVWPIQQEAKEIAWLAGAPFFVQVIEGAGDDIQHILAGPLESSTAAEHLLNGRWRVMVDRSVDVVIASVSGDPARHTIDDLARAFFAAARVVKLGGAIVLLSEVAPSLGRGFEIFRQHDDPSLALRILTQEKTSDLSAGFMWATAANQARLYLLSGLPSDVAEEIFTIPLASAQQAQKLLSAQQCLFLPDAHKTLALLR